MKISLIFLRLYRLLSRHVQGDVLDQEERQHVPQGAGSPVGSDLADVPDLAEPVEDELHVHPEDCQHHALEAQCFSSRW